MVPEMGAVVLYTLTDTDAEAINHRRKDARSRTSALVVAQTGSQTHVGNPAVAGDQCPAMVVRRFGDLVHSPVNLQVFLDGNDTYWATSVSEGAGPGCYLLA